LRKGFLPYLEKENPDIVCIQETKVQAREVVPEDVKGYTFHFNDAARKGHGGTGILTKVPPIKFTNGMGVMEHDITARVIAAEFEKFILVNTYNPSIGSKMDKIDNRIAWDKDYRQYIAELTKNKPVVICGDLNVAYMNIDRPRPEGDPDFRAATMTDSEISGFKQLLDVGLVDAFRHLYPDKRLVYTWWQNFANARERNLGWRIDHFLVSDSIKDKVKEVYTRYYVPGSDHAPLLLHLEKI